MKLLYDNEHLSCSNYEKHCSSSLAEVIRMKQDEVKEFDFALAEVLFLTKGSISVSFQMIEQRVIEQESILFFPPGIRIKITSLTDSELLICRIKDNVRLCYAYTPENLASEYSNSPVNSTPLKFNTRITSFLDSLIPCLEDGLRCQFFIDVKIREMFFLFRAYYTKKQLYDLFFPILSEDVEFTTFIWSNYRRASNVTELANMANYSVSRFNDKFKKAFGIPALTWINEQKARNVYFELKITNRSFDDISDEFYFASTSYLSTFCKKHYNKTPTEIRHGK